MQNKCFLLTLLGLQKSKNLLAHLMRLIIHRLNIDLQIDENWTDNWMVSTIELIKSQMKLVNES